jgi:murein DD-endopeptidase MepM/ murein hydrolase activator NlpD
MDKRITTLRRQRAQRIRQAMKRRYRERISAERRDRMRRSHMVAALMAVAFAASMLLVGLVLPADRALAADAGTAPLPVLTPCPRTASNATVALGSLRTMPRAVPAAYSATPRRCPIRFLWPVKNPEVVRGFDKLEHNWDVGHRGVDLRAETHDELIAPADGVIAFAGIVAGKSVVTIRHGPLTSTFEPAVSNRAVGASVSRGDVFAQVQGESDHCLSECVHWGLKRGKGQYVDPAAMVRGRKIGLLP